jgi:hypothetical protein
MSLFTNQMATMSSYPPQDHIWTSGSHCNMQKQDQESFLDGLSLASAGPEAG